LKPENIDIMTIVDQIQEKSKGLGWLFEEVFEKK
jgi:hypothetical protein